MINLKKTFVLASFLSMGLLVFCFNASPKDKDDSLEKGIFKSVRKTLTYMHYSPKEINDTFSQQVFKKYLESIDPFKRYFLESDINEFKKYEMKMGEMFEKEDLEFYKLSIDRLYERVQESEVYVNEIFKEPLDLKKSEYFITDEKKRANPKDKKGLKDQWRRFVKYNILQEIFNANNLDAEKLLDSLDSLDFISDDYDVKPKGDKKDKEIKKTDKEIEKESIDKVKENLSEFFRRFNKRNKSDFFSVFINAYTEIYDPHTSYFSPKESDDFNSSMSGKIIGIGALLEDKKGYATIKEVVIGGPAWKSKQLESGDKIIKVSQGKNGKPIDIVGMLLDDAIRLIRGKEGTVVVLTLEKKDGTVKLLPLVREEVEMQETFVRSAIVKDKNGDKYGIIYLPEFYVNLENRKGRDCSDDVKREIEELKKEDIKGLVMDVRNNGGGSLGEVVEISSLFVPRGPIVQVKNSDGNINVLDDKKSKGIIWDGPLVLMVNEFSASASEILAGALQDYKRAVIVGSPQTYGKGTVQTVIPLDKLSMSNKGQGALKVTVQKFYRITGSSTQLKGVNSDIVIPDRFEYSDVYEKSRENAMPWDQINGTNYNVWTSAVNYDYVKSKSNERLKNNPYISTTLTIARWYKDLNKEGQFPLEYNQFMRTMNKRKDEAKKFDKDVKYDAKIEVSPVNYELEKFKTDTVLEARRNDWFKVMKKDFSLRESINVINDIVASQAK